LLLLLLGLKSPAGPVAAILIGGVVCCAAAIGGDNLLGIGLAVPVALRHDENAIAIALTPDESGKLVPAYAELVPPALLFVVAVMVLLYVLSLRKDPTHTSSGNPG
jgi:hypothetical protein